MNWFAASFRKVHILFVSPQWAKQRGQAFDADQYADGLAEAGVDCVELYTKDHHGVCYFPCSLGLAYPRDVVGELLTALRQRDIRLMAYVSVCFDNYALGLHPEWRAVNYLGDPYKIGPFTMACLNSPYTDFVLQQIRELVERYAVDGYWLDIIPLARDVPQAVWMTTPMPVPCYCLSCQQSYERETGERLPRQATAAQQELAFQFLAGKVDAFLDRAAAVIHEYRPDAIITYNGAGSPGDPLKRGDLVSIEGHAPFYARQSFIARWGKSSGKPFEILTAGGLPRFELGGGWNGFDQKPPTVMQLESAIALAHGGSTVFGHAPYPNGTIDPGQFAGFAQVFQPMRTWEPCMRVPQGVSDVALILAPKARTASAHWGLMQDGAEAFHEALLDAHIQFDLTPSLDDLARYPLVILADQAALSDSEVEQLRNYVQAGGRLLATGQSALYDEQGQERPDFGLADLFGVSYRRDPGLPFAYVRLREPGLQQQVTTLPIFVDQPPLEVTLKGATILADLVYPEATRTDATTVLWGDPGPDETQRAPALCEHRYGAGICWYAAWPLRTRGLPNAWIKRLMAALVRAALPDPILKTTAPPGVEVVLNRQGARHLVHLVNHHVGTPDRLSYADHSIVLTELTVQLNLARLGIQRVQNVYTPPDTGLAYNQTDGWLTVSVPPLVVHTLLVIE